MQLTDSTISTSSLRGPLVQAKLCTVGNATLYLTLVRDSEDRLLLEHIETDSEETPVTDMEVGDNLQETKLRWGNLGAEGTRRTLTLVIREAGNTPNLVWQLPAGSTVTGSIEVDAKGSVHASLVYSDSSEPTCELCEVSTAKTRESESSTPTRVKPPNMAPKTKIIVLPKPTCPEDTRCPD